MKSQLKSCLISRILSLVGAAILLIPVMAHALPPPALMPAAGVHVITTDGTDTRTGTLRMPAAPTGPINVVTPPPSGPCANQVVVSGIHYPNQSCSQTTPGFLSNMMTMFHFTSKCLPPNHLLGVTNVTCQNAPITGFPNGSVYQGTACCGISPPPPGADLSVTKTCALDPAHGPQAVYCAVTIHNNGSVPSGSPVTLTDNPVSPPSGTLYTSSSGSFGCTAAPGPVSGSMPCNYNGSIPVGQDGTTFFYFKVPMGGTFKNCASATQGGGVVDPNPANNSNICATVIVPPPVGTGTVTVRKVVVAPPGDTGKFTLQLFNGSGLLLANFLNGGNGATMTSGPLPVGNYSVGEVAGNNGTSLSNYTSVISGAGCGANGAVTVAAGSNIVCTITNTRVAVTCTGWPQVADVNIYNPMTPFGPQTVDICRGGHVTFHNLNSGPTWNIQYVFGPSAFSSVSLPNNAVGSTGPLQFGTYEYKINGINPIVVHGHINVH